MNTIIRIQLIVLSFVLAISCSKKKEGTFVSIKNNLKLERTFETLELSKEFLKISSLNNVYIKDVETGKLLVTQLVDDDKDGIMDQLLFQPYLKANAEKKYEIIQSDTLKQPKSEAFCFSRFVPERTDDYAWENNKVAFRVYGPTAQKMIEEGELGGTLSSGVDAWLKKVEYPIIDKWYEKFTSGTGTYHEDTGEGLDNFHVGISRGVGGVAVKNEGSYYYSKNYSEYKTITTGPIRTSFHLNYQDWDANGQTIHESKFISLDFGQNLSKFETFIKGTDIISVGLTLHEKDGEVTEGAEGNWVSYWQPHLGSELGTAIVTANDYYIDYDEYDVNKKDVSNAYANLKVINNKVVYYAGFTWKESNQFKTKQAWEDYLNEFSQKINNPLKISIAE